MWCLDWSNAEAIRSAILDTGRTLIFAVGCVVGYVQLREYYRLRRLQTLASFNERLARSSKATKWIETPDIKWIHLDPETKSDFQNYLATFEDIGAARDIGILDKEDFIASYGGRFEKLYKSGTLTQFIKEAGFRPEHFRNLHVLLQDTGQPTSL